MKKDTNPYFIAEIGVNHEGNIKRAYEMIDTAAEAGADCVKFQMYKAEELAIKNSPAYWDTNKEKTTSQHSLFSKYDCFTFENYKELSLYSKKKKVDFMVTPFSVEGVYLASEISDVIKIASADITNVPLLRAVSDIGKPAIISTGASSYEEIEFAIKELESKNKIEISILHCVLNYPTDPKDAYLERIEILKKKFPDYKIGYSDHVPPHKSKLTLPLAIFYGAEVIEKHYTFDKSLPGNDHYHAFDNIDLEFFKAQLNELISLSGYDIDENQYLANQKPAITNARRSIVAASNLQKNHILTEIDLVTKRPGNGIPSAKWDDIIGKKLIRDVREDDQLSYEDFN